MCVCVSLGKTSSFTFLPTVDERVNGNNVYTEKNVCEDLSHTRVFSVVVKCLPPDCELQYPVWALDEDQGFLSAAVEGGSIYVDELIADSQLLAQSGLPTVLDLETKTHNWRKTGRQTEAHSDREWIEKSPFKSCQVDSFKTHFCRHFCSTVSVLMATEL